MSVKNHGFITLLVSWGIVDRLHGRSSTAQSIKEATRPSFVMCCRGNANISVGVAYELQISSASCFPHDSSD